MDKLDAYLATQNIKPKIKYANVYFLERVYVTQVQELKKLDYVEQVYDLTLALGQAPQEVKKSAAASQTDLRAKSVYKTAVPSPTKPNKKSQPRVKQTMDNVKKPYTPPRPNVTLERVVSNKVVNQEFDNTFTKTSASREAKQFDARNIGKSLGRL